MHEAHATLERTIFHIEDIHAVQKYIISISSAIDMKKLMISIFLTLKIMLFKLNFYKLVTKSVLCKPVMGEHMM